MRVYYGYTYKLYLFTRKEGLLKFDLHCHTKAGSIDSKIALIDYIRLLKQQGFDGMMITDHTTSKGWKAWDEIKDYDEFEDFTVLKGVEYDTRDAGHFIVVLPDDVQLKLLSFRGLPLKHLIQIVHSQGGILGPAHPYGVKSSSAMDQKALRVAPQLINEFDFIEVFNTCETPQSNVRAARLANMHDKPGIAGSDSHKADYVGMAYTEIEGEVKSNNDFIRAIKENRIVDAGGQEREATPGMARKMHWTAVYGFMAYNVGLGFLFTPCRKFFKAYELAM